MEMIADLLLAFDVLEIHGRVSFYRIDEYRVLVYHNGEKFGIWDGLRKTFVD